MTDRVAEMMERRGKANDGDDGGWVFSGNQEDGSLNYSSIDSQHDRLVDKIKLNGRFRLYDLLHTALTRLAESDADAFAIQKIAGHSDIRITSRYVHPTPEHIQKAFTRLQEYNARQKRRRDSSSASLGNVAFKLRETGTTRKFAQPGFHYRLSRTPPIASQT